jgi:Na+-transporting NADH:ubiquinone oxidoreductase subunit A
VVKGQETAWQAGLDVLARLTQGSVHLCLDGRRQNAPALTGARNVHVHTFSGPHPAGNTSVHISRLAPIKPGDAVWTARAADVVAIGQLFLTGEYPSHRTISLAGPGVREASRQHYRMRIGTPLQGLFRGALADGELRIVNGDALSGRIASAADALRLFDVGFTVLREDRERHLLGWAVPGFSVFSASRSFASRWLPRSKPWDLGTNQHGEERPMVLTGLYDKYLPLNIMTDFLVRAVLANDTDEAIKLGILETDPEDFALCAFACPSKMDLVGIIRRGLRDVEREGL